MTELFSQKEIDDILETVDKDESTSNSLYLYGVSLTKDVILKYIRKIFQQTDENGLYGKNQIKILKRILRYNKPNMLYQIYTRRSFNHPDTVKVDIEGMIRYNELIPSTYHSKPNIVFGKPFDLLKVSKEYEDVSSRIDYNLENLHYYKEGLTNDNLPNGEEIKDRIEKLVDCLNTYDVTDSFKNKYTKILYSIVTVCSSFFDNTKMDLLFNKDKFIGVGFESSIGLLRINVEVYQHYTNDFGRLTVEFKNTTLFKHDIKYFTELLAIIKFMGAIGAVSNSIINSGIYNTIRYNHKFDAENIFYIYNKSLWNNLEDIDDILLELVDINRLNQLKTVIRKEIIPILPITKPVTTPEYNHILLSLLIISLTQ